MFQKIRRWWIVALLPISLTIILIMRSFPSAAEWYAKSIYPFFVKIIGSATSLLTFSLGEVLLILVVLLSIVGVVLLIIRIAKHKFTKTNLTNLIFSIVTATSITVFTYVLFCGINYNRYEFSEYSGLLVRPSHLSELVALCNELTDTANALRSEIKTDFEVKTMSERASKSINNLSETYDVIFEAPIKPKAVMTSRIMSHMNITGIFCPFTLEANVNFDVVNYNIPATMCHELAHTRGFMREDEANFIAYLACRESDDLEFKYSGTMLALIHSMNRLYEVNYDAFASVRDRYSDVIISDLETNRAYWAQFDGFVAEISSKVNDTYLKANDQTDGVQGYGRMVDLLLADYRARN